jgi:hypothetical protein
LYFVFARIIVMPQAGNPRSSKCHRCLHESNFRKATSAATVLATLTGCIACLSSLPGGWSDTDLKGVTNFNQTAGIRLVAKEP